MNKKELTAQVAKQTGLTKITTLDEILSKEATNRSAIYLYEQGDVWFAYECSAYLFSQIFKMGDVERTGDCIRIAISNQFEFLNSKAICSVQMTSVADSEVEIACKTTNAGFEQWRQNYFKAD